MQNVRSISVLIVAVGLLLTASTGFAANSLSKRSVPPTSKTVELPLAPANVVSISQSTNQATITAGASVSCNGGSPTFLHTDNSYFRAFTLSAFNPPLNSTFFKVQSVTFGIEQANASGTGTTQPVTVRLFNSSTNPPTNASLGATLESWTAAVPDQTLSLFNVGLLTQPQYTNATGILVFEVFTPSGQAAGHSIFIGSNALGQSGPSFIRAASCGIAEITNLASIGFANMHIVMTVTGDNGLPVELQTFSID